MYFKLVDEKERIMLTLLHQGDLLHLILRNGFLIATQSLAINFLQQQKKEPKKNGKVERLEEYAPWCRGI